MRFNLDQDYMQLLQRLVKVDPVHGLRFLLYQDLTVYEQEQDEFETLTTKNLYSDIGNIINIYQVKDMRLLQEKILKRFILLIAIEQHVEL